jgi:CRP-like cAMP-binding protein
VPLKVVPRRDRKLYRLVKRGETRTLKRGEALYNAGDPSHHLFLVRTGHLRLHLPEPASEEGAVAPRRRVEAVIGPWEIAGEEALQADAPRRLTASTGEPTQVTVLDGPGAGRALQTSKKTLEAFLRAKEEELALARALSGVRRPGGAKARLGALLLHLSARQGKTEGKGILIPISLSHQLLADLSASHRSTVTTLLNDWIYDGVLEAEEAGYRILKPNALGSASGF